jgi:hypothetical protein
MSSDQSDPEISAAVIAFRDGTAGECAELDRPRALFDLGQVVIQGRTYVPDPSQRPRTQERPTMPESPAVSLPTIEADIQAALATLQAALANPMVAAGVAALLPALQAQVEAASNVLFRPLETAAFAFVAKELAGMAPAPASPATV